MNSKSTDSPGNTSCSWGCIQGPTRPLGGALLGSYWQGFHYCCFLDNFLCSSLSLSLWGTDIKTQNNNQKPNSTKEGSEKQKSGLMESRSPFNHEARLWSRCYATITNEAVGHHYQQPRYFSHYEEEGAERCCDAPRTLTNPRPLPRSGLWPSKSRGPRSARPLKSWGG